MCDKNNSSNSYMNGMLLGAALGAFAGLLLAPDKGAVTRDKLQRRTKYLVEEGVEKFGEAKELFEDVKEQSAPYVAEARQDIEPLVRSIVSKISESSGPVKEEVMDALDNLIEAMGDKSLASNAAVKKAKKRFFDGLGK